MIALLRWFVLIALGFGTCAYAKDAVGQPLTDAECEVFGRELAASVNQGRPLTMLEALDLSAFSDRTCEGLGISGIEYAEFKNGLIACIRKSFEAQLQIWKQARFVRVSTVKGEKRVLIRLIADGGALNFLDWVCAPKADGGIKTVDCFPYITAELMSETARRSALPYIAEHQRSFLERLTQRESAYVRAFPQFTEAVRTFHSGNARKAMEILEALPDEVKITPFCLLIRLQASQSVDEKVYLQVIEQWEKALPNDPSLDLVSIDGHILRKDYPACIKRIESLQQRVGGDGYLEALKANVQNMNGNHQEARATVKRAIEQEPSLANSYDIWFGIEMQTRNWHGLANALKAFDRAFPKADIWKGIENEAFWKEFVNSPECTAWRTERADAKEKKPKADAKT